MALLQSTKCNRANPRTFDPTKLECWICPDMVDVLESWFLLFISLICQLLVQAFNAKPLLVEVFNFLNQLISSAVAWCDYLTSKILLFWGDKLYKFIKATFLLYSDSTPVLDGFAIWHEESTGWYPNKIQNLFVGLEFYVLFSSSVIWHCI